MRCIILDDWESSNFNKRLKEYALNNALRSNVIHREGICDYCGNRDLVFYAPTDAYFYCVKHALSIPNIDSLSRRGLVALAPNWMGFLRCHICGKREPVMYMVRYEWLCFKCAWYRIGKASRRLKVDGYRIV